MTRKEFEAVVIDAVANGATREDAEAYVRAGYKLDDESDPSAADRDPAAGARAGDGESTDDRSGEGEAAVTTGGEGELTDAGSGEGERKDGE